MLISPFTAMLAGRMPFMTCVLFIHYAYTNELQSVHEESCLEWQS